MRLDPEKIQTQAKALMDEFIKALDKVEVAGETGIEREKSTRVAKACPADEDFRKRMLKNAPRKDDDHILAEKKSW
jgi:hypothetical protein